jgi:hypothetical protein
MHVVFIHGPCAAGKHTIGAQLSALTGLPLFHNHLAVDAAMAVFPFGTSSFNNVRAAVWRTTFAEAAATGRSFIFTFAPDATVEPSLVNEMTGSVEKRGGRVFYVELRCSADTIIRRLGDASRVRFRKLTDTALYKTIDGQGGFAFPPFPAPLICLDTDHIGPAEAAERIAHALSMEHETPDPALQATRETARPRS